MDKIIFKNSTNVKFQQLKNSIGRDKMRPSMTGVFLDVKNNAIVVTNGQSLFAYDIQITKHSSDEELHDIVIDPKIFNQLNWLSIHKDDLELVDFHVSVEKTEVFIGEEVVAIAKNIEHDTKFPNWKNVVQISQVVNEMKVDSDLLKSCFSSLPVGFKCPEIKFGNKILIKSIGFDNEEREVSILGVVMPLFYPENRIYEKSTRFSVDKESNLERLIGKTLTRRIVSTWNEEFVDEDNGEVVSVERNEIIVDKDTVLLQEHIDEIKRLQIKDIFILKKDE